MNYLRPVDYYRGNPEVLWAEQKVEYILGMRLRRHKEVNLEVLGWAGQYHELAENLRVKEVWVDDRRYMVCHNTEVEVRDRRAAGGDH